MVEGCKLGERGLYTDLVNGGGARPYNTSGINIPQ